MGRLFQFARVGALLTLAFWCALPTAGAARPPDASARLSPPDPGLDYIGFYKGLRAEGKGVLVTIDSALWGAAALQVRGQMALETHALTPCLREVLNAIGEALEPAAADPPGIRVGASTRLLPRELVEPARRARLHVLVASSLLDAAQRPAPEVREEVERIRAHAGFADSCVLEQRVDYARFEPEGPYLRSKPLEIYWLATRWLSDALFRLDEAYPFGPCAAPEAPLGDSARSEGRWFAGVATQRAAAGERDEMAKFEARYPRAGYIEMRAAGLMSVLMQHTQTPGGRTALEAWREMEALEAAWWGASPHVGPWLLLRSMRPEAEELIDFETAFKLLSDDYDTVRWIAWLESRVALPYGPPGFGRRGFSLAGRPADTDALVLEFLAGGAPWPCIVTESDTAEAARFAPTRFPPLGGLGLAAMAQLPLARRLLAEGNDALRLESSLTAKRATRLWAHYAQEGSETYTGVRRTTLRLVQRTVRPSDAANPPHYLQHPDRDLLRLNAGLAYWLLTRSDAAALEGPTAFALQGQGLSTSDAEPSGLRGYVEPYPDLYAALATAAREMGAVFEKAGIDAPIGESASRLYRLDAESRRADCRAHAASCAAYAERMDALERIARLEVTAPEEILPEDHGLLGDWGRALERALALPPRTAERIPFRLRAPLAALATVQEGEETCMQAATGGLWQVCTHVEIEGLDVAVCGAIVPYYEFARPRAQRLTPQAWQTALETDANQSPAVLCHLSRSIPLPETASR